MTRNRLLLTPQRIITDGLIAHHDLWFPNILLQSENMSGWDGTRASASGAELVVENAGASTTHFVYVTSGLLAGPATLVIEAKAKERSHLRLYVNGAATYSQYFHLHDAGSVSGTQSASTTSAIVALADGWYRPTFTYTMSSAGVYVMLCSKTPSDTYSGDGASGLYLRKVHLYPCASAALMPPYSATTTLQSESGLLDLSGNGYHLSRGSNASAADTNDPMILGPGLRCVADDYAKTAALSGVTSAGDFTLILCGLFNGSGIGNCIASFGSAAGEMQWLQEFGAGELKIISTSSTSNSSASRLAVSTTAPSALAITNSNDTLTCTRLDTGASITVADKNPTGAPVLTIGAKSGGTGPATALTAYGDLLYNRVLSAAELQHNRRALKTLWAARGVTIL